MDESVMTTIVRPLDLISAVWLPNISLPHLSVILCFSWLAWLAQCRDLTNVASKLRLVLWFSRGSQEDTLKALRNWDLWGPLLLCLTLAL